MAFIPLFPLFSVGRVRGDGVLRYRKAFLGHDTEGIGGRTGSGPKSIIEVEGALFHRFLKVGIANVPIVFCQSGVRSKKAATILVQHGFEHVSHVKGGAVALYEIIPDLTGLCRIHFGIYL